MMEKKRTLRRRLPMVMILTLLFTIAVAALPGSISSSAAARPDAYGDSTAAAGPTGVVVQDATRPRIRFATGIDAGYAPYFVAVARGFMKRQGLNASITLFDSGPAAQEAVIGKRADVTQNAELPQQVPASRGADIFVVASSYHPTRNMCIMARPEIRRPQDLVGKTVAYLQLSGGQYLWSVWATKHGIQTRVKTVSLAPPEMLPAMARGDVHAAAIWTPWCNLVTSVVNGGHVLSWPGADEGLYQPDNATIFSGWLVKKQPQVGRKVMRALIASAVWINENPTAAAKIVSTYIRQTPAAAEQQLRGIMPFRMRFEDSDVRNFVNVATWAKNTKIVTYPQTPRQLMMRLLNPCILRSVAPGRVKLKQYKWRCR